MTTLAALISGIVGSKSPHLPPIATQVPDGTKPASRVQRFARWGGNDTITEQGEFVPYAEVLLRRLALQTLGLILDGRVVGRGGIALMRPVVYKGRALPLVWQVRRGKQGHCPADLHLALVQEVHDLIPVGAQVVVLGDGACDGTRLLHTVQAYGWSSVVRTGSPITVAWDRAHCRSETVGACIKPGTLVALPDVRVTAAAYGPLLLLCCWGKGDKEPLYLLTNLPAADAACSWYPKRCRIATCFSDQKSRGFPLHTSPVADPLRVSRLLLAAC